jgi:hypothetical protein
MFLLYVLAKVFKQNATAGFLEALFFVTVIMLILCPIGLGVLAFAWDVLDKLFGG